MAPIADASVGRRLQTLHHNLVEEKIFANHEIQANAVCHRSFHRFYIGIVARLVQRPYAGGNRIHGERCARLDRNPWRIRFQHFAVFFDDSHFLDDRRRLRLGLFPCRFLGTRKRPSQNRHQEH